MRMKALAVASLALVWLAVGAPVRAGKPIDLGKTKYKEIAKYLDLTPSQEKTIKLDIERIQDLVKQAEKQRGTPGYGAGGRTPIGSGQWGGGIGGSPTSVQVGRSADREAQRAEWRKEITNRIEEIKSLLTPPQLEKFKTIKLPDLMASEE